MRMLVWMFLGAKRVQRAVLSKDRSIHTSSAFSSEKPVAPFEKQPMYFQPGRKTTVLCFN